MIQFVNQSIPLQLSPSFSSAFPLPSLHFSPLPSLHLSPFLLFTFPPSFSLPYPFLLFIFPSSFSLPYPFIPSSFSLPYLFIPFSFPPSFSSPFPLPSLHLSPFLLFTFPSIPFCLNPSYSFQSYKVFLPPNLFPFLPPSWK